MENIPSLEGISFSRATVDHGRVIDGLDTLELLEKTEVNHKHRPLKEIRLQNVTIHANPLADETI
jgi:peptidyl-prolyl cis-trans isomerase-like 3